MPHEQFGLTPRRARPALTITCARWWWMPRKSSKNIGRQQLESAGLAAEIIKAPKRGREPGERGCNHRDERKARKQLIRLTVVGARICNPLWMSGF